jgi:hypothetical protein
MSNNTFLALMILWYSAIWGTAVYLVAFLDRSVWWLVLAAFLSTIEFSVRRR